MAHADQNAAGMEAYFRPSRPYKLTCACNPAHPGWFDAGCVFHGIKSNAGKWDGEEEFDIFRKHVMSRPNGNNRWD
jgi:hypothetical protein